MQKCRHDGCRCEGAAAYDGYCSSYCAEANRTESAGQARRCGCGHPPCGDARR